MSIAKIVSGAQTGADQGALEAALYCSLPYGGWIPKGRKAEKGAKIPSKFDQLREMQTGDYLARTEANVVDSSATLVFTYGKATGGSLKTIEFAKKHRKPVLHIAIDEYSRTDIANFVERWFDGDITKPTPPKNCILNVAGSRESKAPGLQDSVMRVMIEVINRLNHVMFYPPPQSDISQWILHEAKPGDVVMLQELTNGREPGHYVLLGRDEDSINLCSVGEDENGDMCKTDDKFALPLRLSRLLRKTGLSVDAAEDE